MSTPYEFDQHRLVFGETLKRWFRRQGWPQSITEHWAKATGCKGPWASQISTCFPPEPRLDPKAQFFAALGQFNHAIAEQDFTGVTDRRLLDMLKGTQALCHDDDGTPFDAADFFSLFIGLIEPPESLQNGDTQEYSDAGAEAYGKALEAAFKKIARDNMMSAKEAWTELQKQPAVSKLYKKDSVCKGLAVDILRGEHVLTGEEIQIAMEKAGGVCACAEGLKELSGEPLKNLDKVLDAAMV